LSYDRQKKKNHGKGWATLLIDEMLRGHFKEPEKYKKIIPRVRIFFRR
jgi:hypothetical protein